MDKHHSKKLHYYIRGAILLGLTSYIAYLAYFNKLHYYIVPKMIPYIMLTTFVLYILALYSIYLAWQEKRKHEHENEHEHRHDCDCQHEPPTSKLKSTFIYSLFILPLLLGFALPDQLMGSDMAAVKGMNLSAGAGSIANGNEMLTENKLLTSTSSSSNNAAADAGEQTVPSSAAGDKSEVDERGEIVSAVQDEGLSSKGPTDGANETNEYGYIDSENEGINSDKAAAGSAEGQPLSVQSFDALFPSDQYSVELAELGKLLYQQDTITVTEEGFLEILTTLDLYRENFLGKSIAISGFVYREDDMSSDKFVVSRMAMQCCSADASPYGFLVQWDDANTLEKDAWVHITGEFALTSYRGIEIVQLNVKQLNRTEAPNDPYVYPYFDDFVKLVELQ